jgi:hypothetical protein
MLKSPENSQCNFQTFNSEKGNDPFFVDNSKDFKAKNYFNPKPRFSQVSEQKSTE